MRYWHSNKIKWSFKYSWIYELWLWQLLENPLAILMDCPIKRKYLTLKSREKRRTEEGFIKYYIVREIFMLMF